MIYLAGPFFKPRELKFVEELEGLFVSAGLEFFSPRKSGVLLDLSEEERMNAKGRIFNLNVDNIADCDIVVAIIDDRDVGTIWEMGLAHALGKRTISISSQNYGLNVMLAESVQAHVTNTNDLMEAIENPEFKGDLVKGVY